MRTLVILHALQALTCRPDTAGLDAEEAMLWELLLSVGRLKPAAFLRSLLVGPNSDVHLTIERRG